MAVVEKANVVLRIDDCDVDYYVSRGYKEVKTEEPKPKPKRTRKPKE